MSTHTCELVHIWSRCHACGAQPIVGRRFECQTCPIGPDNALCDACQKGFEQGTVKHPMPGSLAEHRRVGSHVFRMFEGSPLDKYLPWIRVPQANAYSPRTPDHFVVRPEFCCGPDSFFGSYSFIVALESNGPLLLLTALHVMDELLKATGIDCSDNASYNGQDLPRLVTKVNLYDALAQRWMLAKLGSARSMLNIPDARVGDEEPYSQRDVAAFWVDRSPSLSPAALADTPPGVGEPIWLVVNTGQGTRERTVKAVVVELTDETFIFRFDAPKLLPQHTSGAPLINRRGSVVGINIGGGWIEGYQLGHGNHVTSIRRHLRSSCARPEVGGY